MQEHLQGLQHPDKKTGGRRPSRHQNDQSEFSSAILQFTWEDHANVSPDDEVEDGVDEHQPAQPTERGGVSSDGRGVRVAPMNA